MNRNIETRLEKLETTRGDKRCLWSRYSECYQAVVAAKEAGREPDPADMDVVQRALLDRLNLRLDQIIGL